jgi:hypothetical protein
MGSEEREFLFGEKYPGVSRRKGKIENSRTSLNRSSAVNYLGDLCIFPSDLLLNHLQCRMQLLAA